MTRTRPRVLLHALSALAFLLLPALARPEAAELFFSEYVEGSSSNKAVEIYNGTDVTVDLGALGYNVQIFTNGSATGGTPIDLMGTLAAGDAFVLAHASAILPVSADQTDTFVNYNGDDAVVLRRGTTIVDVIGQIGLDPGAEWGTGLASTADNTLRRKQPICAGDTNGSDAFAPALEWVGFANDTFDGLGTHVADCGVVDLIFKDGFE
jgi:uncharacterized protein